MFLGIESLDEFVDQFARDFVVDPFLADVVLLNHVVNELGHLRLLRHRMDIAQSALEAAGIESMVAADDAGETNPGLWESRGVAVLVIAAVIAAFVFAHPLGLEAGTIALFDEREMAGELSQV